jgi:hypothetical protein
LPVKRLNFGGISSKGSGQHTLGRLECKGKVHSKKMPESCEDLWRNGQTIEGLYSVMGNRTMEKVYCDFSKLPNEQGNKQF